MIVPPSICIPGDGASEVSVHAGVCARLVGGGEGGGGGSSRVAPRLRGDA